MEFLFREFNISLKKTKQSISDFGIAYQALLAYNKEVIWVIILKTLNLLKLFSKMIKIAVLLWWRAEGKYSPVEPW